MQLTLDDFLDGGADVAEARVDAGFFQTGVGAVDGDCAAFEQGADGG